MLRSFRLRLSGISDVPFHNDPSFTKESFAQHDHERDILFSLRIRESVSDIAV
jgi:hypothetical protein